MWSWHWSPLTQTSLLLTPSEGLASFLKTTLANGVKVVKKVITSKFRFHLIAINALGCFRNFSCTPVPTYKTHFFKVSHVACNCGGIIKLLKSTSSTYIWIRVMVFNATFNNISVIYRGGHFFFVEETGRPAENQRPVASHWQTLSVLIEIQTHISGDRHRFHR
jgi:hypothetical protein